MKNLLLQGKAWGESEDNLRLMVKKAVTYFMALEILVR